MARHRRLPPWYWVVLGGMTALLVLYLANQVLGWEQKWIVAALPIASIATGIYSFRLLWKQTDHPAFHSDRSESDPAAKE